MTPRPHVLNDCWCGADHETEIRGDGDDLRVRPSDPLAGSQAGLSGPSGSLNPSPRRGRMEQDEFNSRVDAGEDPYAVVADDRERSAAMIDLEAGSDEERCWRGEWLSRLMFGWMLGQRDPGTYEEWLTANGARLV